MPEPFDRLQAALADRYAVERELGVGGMAVVYLALDLKHHRRVAIKAMKPEDVRREVGPLEHPGVYQRPAQEQR